MTKLGSIFGGMPDAASLDPTHPMYSTGSMEDQEQARAAWHVARFTAEVMRADLPEIPREDLERLPYGPLEDKRTGTFYKARRDGCIDLHHTNAVAFFTGVDGVPVLLEKPPGAQNRAELEAQRAEREQRRNAPKRRPTWMT